MEEPCFSVTVSPMPVCFGGVFMGSIDFQTMDLFFKKIAARAEKQHGRRKFRISGVAPAREELQNKKPDTKSIRPPFVTHKN